MTTDIWINFRQTSGYVTDGTGETYCISSESHPTTRAGETFGFETTSDLNSRDRSTSYSTHLAGIVFTNATPPMTGDFWYEVPDGTGDYDIRFGGGENHASATANGQTLKFKDGKTSSGASTLFSISKTSGMNNKYFVDATDVIRTSNSDWDNNNAQQTSQTLNNTDGSGSETIFTIELEEASGAADSCKICTFHIENAAGGGSTPRLFSGMTGIGI